MNTKLIIMTTVVIFTVFTIGLYSYVVFSLLNQKPHTTTAKTDTTANIVNDLQSLPSDNALNNEIQALDQSIKGL